jgi:hypothetical protein
MLKTIRNAITKTALNLTLRFQRQRSDTGTVCFDVLPFAPRFLADWLRFVYLGITNLVHIMEQAKQTQLVVLDDQAPLFRHLIPKSSA